MFSKFSMNFPSQEKHDAKSYHWEFKVTIMILENVFNVLQLSLKFFII